MSITPEKLFMELHAIAAALAALRLLQLGLARRQPALLCYLVLMGAANLDLSLLPLHSPDYFWHYVAILPLSLLSEIAVTRELFELTMSDYPGIRSAANRSMYWALGISAFTSLALSAILWNESLLNQSKLYYVLQLERSVQCGLAIVVISLLLFLSRFPLRLHRNVYVSSYFFCFLFLIEAADTQIAAISPHLYSRQIDLGSVLISCVLFIGWTSMLRARTSIAVKPAAEDSREHELLLQLESLNRILSQAGRQ